MRRSLGLSIVPSEGVSSPAMSFNKVDLPAPFLPVRAIRSREETTKAISSKSENPPKRTVTLLIEIIVLSS